jgi:hypothetical protein
MTLAAALISVATSGAALAQGRTALAIAGASRTVVQAQPADKTATVYGVKIHYLEAGSGPVVILTVVDDVSGWASTIGPLSQKQVCDCAPDRFGHWISLL